MEKKYKEQVRQMRELQDRDEHLQRENDCLWAHVEKRHNLGKGDAQDSEQAKPSTVRDKGKKSIIPDDADIPVDGELSSSLNLSLKKKRKKKQNRIVSKTLASLCIQQHR